MDIDKHYFKNYDTEGSYIVNELGKMHGPQRYRVVYEFYVEANFVNGIAIGKFKVIDLNNKLIRLSFLENTSETNERTGEAIELRYW